MRTACAGIVQGDAVPAVPRVHVHALHFHQVPARAALLRFFLNP